MVQLQNDNLRSSFDGENRFFNIKVTFSYLRHSQFCIEDNFLKLKGDNLLANLQTILLTWFVFPKHSGFSHSVNYAKTHERQSNVKCW